MQPDLPAAPRRIFSRGHKNRRSRHQGSFAACRLRRYTYALRRRFRQGGRAAFPSGSRSAARLTRRRRDPCPHPTTVTAAVLVIGDEILSGRTKDKNIGYIAEYLAQIGVDLREARVVPDVEDEIVAALNALRARYDYVFTTGGIGPTHDDITADAVAKAFGVGDRRGPARDRDHARALQARAISPPRGGAWRASPKAPTWSRTRSPRRPGSASAMCS